MLQFSRCADDVMLMEQQQAAANLFRVAAQKERDSESDEESVAFLDESESLL
jgi:hypothetical protein